MPVDFLPIISYFPSAGTLPRKHHQSGRLSPNSNPTTRSDTAIQKTTVTSVVLVPIVYLNNANPTKKSHNPSKKYLIGLKQPTPYADITRS